MSKAGDHDVEMPLPANGQGDENWLYLSAAGRTVVVGTGREPYWWTWCAPISHSLPGARCREAPSAGHTFAAAQLNPGGQWIALAPLRTKSGFIQTLADLTSELRVLVLYDSSGTVLRRSEIRAPMALVASSPGEGLVLGVVSLERFELLIYRLAGD